MGISCYVATYFNSMGYIKTLKSYLLQSNRYKHLLYSIPVGLIFTILCVLGLATGMELKDKMYKDEWDWTDWKLTMIGGLIGQIIQIILIIILFG